jgi:hypothetical protein
VAVEAEMDEDHEERDKKLNDCVTAYSQSRENIEGQLFAFIKANQEAIKL